MQRTLMDCGMDKQDKPGRAAKRRKRESHLRAYKTCQCPVLGQIELPALCVRVMDTPQFQRLSRCKQLGTSHFVFRGGVHSRFEHSIGVAHLARELLAQLCAEQPELVCGQLRVDQTDQLCVMLAGLCHDLGHGPFSHVFERVIGQLGVKGHCHEKGSVAMFKHLLTANNIDPAEYGLSEKDVLFVEEMILGSDIKGGVASRRGREPSKHFLYDIVNNVRSGLDMDKLDYFLRDKINCIGVNMKDDFWRFIKLARLCRIEDGSHMICYPSKMASEALDFFRHRFDMHEKVYQHRCTKQVELMVIDMLLAAHAHLLIYPLNPDGERCGPGQTIASCVEKPEYLAQMDDGIMDQVKRLDPTGEPDLRAAQKLIARIESRQLYQMAGSVSLCGCEKRADGTVALSPGSGVRRCMSCGCSWLDGKLTDAQIIDAVVKCSSAQREASELKSEEEDEELVCSQQPPVKQRTTAAGNALCREDIMIEQGKIHYGHPTKKESNPVKCMRFYEKSDAEEETWEGREVEDQLLLGKLPRSFLQKSIK